MKKAIIFIMTVALFSFFASCHSANSDSKSATANNDSIKEPQTPQPVGQSGINDNVSAKNILQTAIESKNHTILVSAVKAAELVEVLSNQGPFTVFAPNDEAFKKLPAGTIEDLMKPEKKSELQDILQYHVTVGVFNADVLKDGQILGLANGGTMKITLKDGKIRVNGAANVIGSIRTSNGIIHVIDAVLLPKECCATHNSQYCNICD